MKLIPLNKYKGILKVSPILCVDIVIQNQQGRYLLVKRLNEPKKGKWWVVGGRVHKGETLQQAAIRKIREEVGLSVKKVQAIGYFELVRGVSPFGLPFNNHTVSVVFKAVFDNDQSIVLDKQSASFIFAKKLPSDFNVKLF